MSKETFRQEKDWRSLKVYLESKTNQRKEHYKV